MTPDRKRALEERGAKIAEANQQSPRAAIAKWPPSRWDASPISTARLSAEIWAQIRNEDWSLVSNDRYRQLLADDGCGISTKHYQYIGGAGRGGHRLRRAGGGGRGAGQPQARAPDASTSSATAI